MASPHPLLTLTFLLVGSFAGGAFVASVRPVQAQEVPPNVKSSDVLNVPAGGLNIVGPGNRLLGRIADVGGNAGLVLFDRDGNASVSLVTGPAGSLKFLAQDGADLALQAGGKSVSLTARALGSAVFLGTHTSLRSDGNGSYLTLRAPTGSNSLDLEAAPGKLELLGRSSVEHFKLSFTDQPSLILKSGTGEAGFEAFGSGKALVRSDGKVVWQVPDGG